MSKDEFIRKISSRKLWIALCGFVTSILIFCNVDEGSISQIIAIIMNGATLISYIVAEGFIDASREIDKEGE